MPTKAPKTTRRTPRAPARMQRTATATRKSARKSPSATRTHAPRAVAARTFDPRSIWLAGVAVAARARQQGEKTLASLIVESKQVRIRTTQLARRVGSDARGQVGTLLTPVRKRVRAQLKRVETFAERGAGRVLARIGVPSKGDVDVLVARIDALSKQLKTSKRATKR